MPCCAVCILEHRLKSIKKQNVLVMKNSQKHSVGRIKPIIRPYPMYTDKLTVFGLQHIENF